MATVPGWAAQVFSAPVSSRDVERVCQELRLRRLDHDPNQWSCANDQVIVFVSLSFSEVYLVGASTSAEEADWVIKSLQRRLQGGASAALAPPPARRGQGVVQWLQIRDRRARGVNARNVVQAALSYFGWQGPQWGTDGCAATRGEQLLLVRWKTIPGGLLRFYVFLYRTSDPQGAGNRACQELADYLAKSTRID